MAPDEFQKAWQADSTQTRVTIDANLLQNEVQRSQRNFRVVIFWRDFREVGIALIMLPYWIYIGVTKSLPWTWYLTIPALVFVAGFILVDRKRHPKKPSDASEPLLESVKESLTQMEHQIWLLRNVFWWYLLPLTISILAFFAHCAWLSARDGNWLPAMVSFMGQFAVLLVVYLIVYFINQRAVRVDLQPRRQELLALLGGLEDESSLAGLEDESSSEFVTPKRAEGVRSPRKVWRWFVAATVLCLGSLVVMVMVLTSGFFDSSYDGPVRSSGPAGDSLARLIIDQRSERNLVGLAAMVMVDGQVEAAAAHGQRKIGSGVPLEISDRWHLGGITKSITATMIARLIESGQMQWSDTLGDIFPEAPIHEDWKPVTLKQVLTDTAGAPANFSLQVRRQRPALGPQCARERRKAVLGVIADPPAYPPGTRFEYSNVGYTIAGAMAEEVTGVSWEDLVKREVSHPLRLAGVGLGPPKSSDELLQEPRGHREYLGGKIPMNDKADNTPIMGPSATVHMTLHDLCTFATEHLRGDLGQGKLLSSETYKILHTPDFSDYACGWMRKEPSEEIPYTVYWHNGSNTFWYAMVAFIPETNTVVAITSNDSDGEQAEAAAREILKASVNRFNTAAELTVGTGDAKRSPFGAVRWQESQPEVRLDGDWFKLVSLDGLPTSQIMDFSRRTYGDKWRKRFEEDLVELLIGMKHPPQDNVTLVVGSLTSSQTWVREDVPLTEANRQAIRAAAKNLEINEEEAIPDPQPASAPRRVLRTAVSIDNPETFRKRIDEFLQLARDKAGFSGVAVVAQGGAPVYQGAFGFSHLASKTPNSLDTPFRIASLSKQFTAAAILSIEAEGKLSLEDPVHRYLNEFTEEPYRGITIGHLLTHTSGLPRTPESAARHARWDAMSKAPTPVDDYVQLACQCPLQFKPGQGRQYSNFGYRVLSSLIVRITGKDYADFMEERLFSPLGLRQSGVARISQPPEEAKVAESVNSSDSSRNYGAGYGSGGIYSSANDLLRWDRVLAGDNFLSVEQKAKLFRPVRDHYACGWIVKESGLDGRLYQTHSGSNEGYFSKMMRLPEDDLVIIVLGNVRKTDELDDVLDQLFRLCRSLPYHDL